MIESTKAQDAIKEFTRKILESFDHTHAYGDGHLRTHSHHSRTEIAKIVNETLHEHLTYKPHTPYGKIEKIVAEAVDKKLAARCSLCRCKVSHEEAEKPPNAGVAWDKKEDAALAESFGDFLRTMSTKHGRTFSAIRARISKIFYGRED